MGKEDFNNIEKHIENDCCKLYVELRKKERNTIV